LFATRALAALRAYRDAMAASVPRLIKVGFSTRVAQELQAPTLQGLIRKGMAAHKARAIVRPGKTLKSLIREGKLTRDQAELVLASS
jgi:hypothetical protein